MLFGAGRKAILFIFNDVFITNKARSLFSRLTNCLSGRPRCLLCDCCQGRHHGVDWGGHAHPTFIRSAFIPMQKRHKKHLIYLLAINFTSCPPNFLKSGAAPDCCIGIEGTCPLIWYRIHVVYNSL